MFPQPPGPQLNTNPRVDLHLEKFEGLLGGKGVDVQVEKALQCPCKSESQNQQTSCENCGGCGWIFVNPRQTRFVLTGMNATKDYEPWSEVNRGIINFSCSQGEDLSFMDRIIRLNARSIFNEVIHFKQKNTTIFSYMVYAPKEIEYLGVFISDTEPLRRLQASEYTITQNRIVISPSVTGLPELPFSATIRYVHAPTFHVLDLKRESMDNYRIDTGTEQLQLMPMAGWARRAHYITDFEDLSGMGLLDNNYDEENCVCNT